MGKRGPKPTPTVVKKLKGNPGRRPLPKSEPQPSTKTPTCPTWLGAVGKRYWRQAIREMPEGLMTRLDTAALSQYAHAWERYHEARDLIAAAGPVVANDKGNLVAHPAVAILNKCSDIIRRFGAEFGMSPTSRVGLVAPEKEEKDKFLEMLERRQGIN